MFFKCSIKARRTVSGRDNPASPFSAAQDARAVSKRGCIRTNTGVPCPVGAGPRFFFDIRDWLTIETAISRRSSIAKMLVTLVVPRTAVDGSVCRPVFRSPAACRGRPSMTITRADEAILRFRRMASLAGDQQRVVIVCGPPAYRHRTRPCNVG